MKQGITFCVTICGRISTLWDDAKNFGHFERVHLVFGKILNLLWLILNAIGQIFIAENDQNWTNNLSIRAHWSSSLEGKLSCHRKTSHSLVERFSLMFIRYKTLNCAILHHPPIKTHTRQKCRKDWTFYLLFYLSIFPFIYCAHKSCWPQNDAMLSNNADKHNVGTPTYIPEFIPII